MAKVPGIKTRHCIISDKCRTTFGDEGALNIAFDNIKEVYLDLLKESITKAKFHIILNYERDCKNNG
jgi:hypothetical protein